MNPGHADPNATGPAPGVADLLEARLAALREAGAEGFDPPGFGLIASLRARALALEGGARARLEARALTRLEQLEEAFRRARAVAEEQLCALEAAGTAVDRTLVEALARGELAAVARAARRQLRELDVGREKTAVPWLARLRGEAASREVRLPAPLARDLQQLARDGDVVERGEKRRAHAVGNALSATLFRESLVSARAALAVARAADNVPEDAGPYNAQALSARALAAVERLSPLYLRALVAGLQDLGVVAAALEPEPGGAPRKKAPARRGGEAGSPGRSARTARRTPAARVR
jgi:Protein of unknown function (DUF2894)